MYAFKHFIKGNSKPFFENKKSNRVVNYAFKSFGQLFTEYLFRTYVV